MVQDLQQTQINYIIEIFQNNKMNDIYSQKTSKPSSRTSQGAKISLRKLRLSTLGSQYSSKNTTSNQNNHQVSKRKSLKYLLTYTSNRSKYENQNFESIQYENIKKKTGNTNKYLSYLFCSRTRGNLNEGCRCSPKCICMEYWLSLTKNLYVPSYRYPVSPKTDQQIKKDISRTQSDSVEFSKIYYQQALYRCLVAYAAIDPEVGYVQGMNIVCSVLIYHGNNIDQCIQIFRYIMVNCRLRDIYLKDFQWANNLTAKIEDYLKYKCHDLYKHMMLQNQISLLIYSVGWLLPLMGNIIPLSLMHLMINIFIERRWSGIVKVIVAMLLYLKKQILSIYDQSQLMYMLSTQQLRNKEMQWEQIIQSSQNITNINI